MPTVDVIIPTFNRHARLERTLRALAAQEFRDFRVIVSDDASAPAVAPFTSAGAGVTVVRSDENRGPAAARNAAVVAGSGSLLAFVDDDVDPAPGWLAAHVAAHAESDALVTIGPLRAPRDWRPTPWNWWEAATLDREYRRMEEGVYAATCRQFFTGNAMVSRARFEAAGGFDVGLARAEDIELGVRLAEHGCAFAFLPGAVGWHYARRSFASWQRMARQYAAADLAIERAHPAEHWLRMIREEMADRSLPLRAVRAAGRLPGAERVLSSMAGLGAHAAFRAGRRDVSTRLLSALYDVTYSNELRRLAA
jgi:GT2 family glycosyltransferase